MKNIIIIVLFVVIYIAASEYFDRHTTTSVSISGVSQLVIDDKANSFTNVVWNVQGEKWEIRPSGYGEMLVIHNGKTTYAHSAGMSVLIDEALRLLQEQRNSKNHE